MCAPWIRPKLPFFFCTETWFCGCAFRKVWEQVIAVGLYQQYDWTLKMDRVIEAWYVTYDSNSLVFLWFVPLISNEWTCRTQRLHFYLLDSKMYCQCHRIPSNCMQLLCWFADYQCLLTLDWIQRTPHCSTLGHACLFWKHLFAGLKKSASAVQSGRLRSNLSGNWQREDVPCECSERPGKREQKRLHMFVFLTVCWYPRNKQSTHIVYIYIYI